MIRYRLDYVFAKVGFTRLQHLFHAKKAWTALKSDEEKRPRPFRLRLQDVKVFVRGPDSPEDEYLDPKLLPDPLSKKIGEVGASAFDTHFRPGRPLDGTVPHSLESRYTVTAVALAAAVSIISALSLLDPFLMLSLCNRLLLLLLDEYFSAKKLFVDNSLCLSSVPSTFWSSCSTAT
jgi:hypothetical protein